VKFWRKWLAWLEAADQDRRRRAQRDDPRTQLMQVCVRLDEARRYVERDRAVERKERDRLILQRQTARDRLTELEQLLRTYLLSQQILDAEHARAAAGKARDALASDFGAMEG
jgi:hypothetical protein